MLTKYSDTFAQAPLLDDSTAGDLIPEIARHGHVDFSLN